MRGLGLLAGLPVLSHLLQKGRVALSARPDGCARYPPAAQLVPVAYARLA